MPPKSAVLLPLYIYPLTPKTWEPLYEAISTYPNVNFVIIVNPNSGPGAHPSPDASYAREVPKLNSYPNVCTIGYIRIHYCKKPLSKAFEEIDAYASWSKNEVISNLGMHGIMVDETPNHYSETAAEYLDAIHKHIKSVSGILGDRMVVHNPGTPPDRKLAEPGPDMMVVCEEPYEKYRSETVQQRLQELYYDRVRSGFQVHSVPQEELPGLVHELRQRGAYLFVTEVKEDFYEKFGESWGKFLEAMSDGMED